MDFSIIIMLGGFVLLMMFMTRGQRKRQKEAVKFRDSLEVGTQVMTASGMVGTISNVEGDLITLESPDGSASRWVKAAIAKPYEAPEGVDQAVAVTEAADTGFAVPDDVSALIEKPNSDDESKN